MPGHVLWQQAVTPCLSPLSLLSVQKEEELKAEEGGQGRRKDAPACSSEQARRAHGGGGRAEPGGRVTHV